MNYTRPPETNTQLLKSRDEAIERVNAMTALLLSPGWKVVEDQMKMQEYNAFIEVMAASNPDQRAFATGKLGAYRAMLEMAANTVQYTQEMIDNWDKARPEDFDKE